MKKLLVLIGASFLLFTFMLPSAHCTPCQVKFDVINSSTNKLVYSSGLVPLTKGYNATWKVFGGGNGHLGFKITEGLDRVAIHNFNDEGHYNSTGRDQIRFLILGLNNLGLGTKRVLGPGPLSGGSAFYKAMGSVDEGLIRLGRGHAWSGSKLEFALKNSNAVPEPSTAAWFIVLGTLVIAGAIKQRKRYQQ